MHRRRIFEGLKLTNQRVDPATFHIELTLEQNGIEAVILQSVAFYGVDLRG